MSRISGPNGPNAWYSWAWDWLPWAWACTCWGGVAGPRGLAFPLVAVALIQLALGVTIFLRSPKDIVRVEGLVAAGGMGIRQQEIPRMQQVMRSFAWYKYAEMALMAAGALLFLPGGNPYRRGLGLGCSSRRH